MAIDRMWAAAGARHPDGKPKHHQRDHRIEDSPGIRAFHLRCQQCRAITKAEEEHEACRGRTGAIGDPVSAIKLQ